MNSSESGIVVKVLDGFEDRLLNDSIWRTLLEQGETNTVFLTPWWQKAWWQTFGRGQLLVLGIFHEKRLVGIAPMFADGGMVFFTGSGGSDYLDFIGEIPDPHTLVEILYTAANLVDGFCGFRFYHVPDQSKTGLKLKHAAQTLGLVCYDEGGLLAPAIDLSIAGGAVTQKKSLVRHQRFFEREGSLSISHFTAAKDILPRLDNFFAQHIARWASTPYPSLFLDPNQCRFYELLCRTAGANSGLRFTEVTWNNSPIAYHFGFKYGNSYMWYKPSFAIQYARRSPGEVLLRSLFFAAIEEGTDTFDFGLGDEPFKMRFATNQHFVRTWGVYPESTSVDLPGSDRKSVQ